MRDLPLILAIETSGSAGSTALLEGAMLLAERRFNPAVRGGSELHPGVVHVLEAARGAPLDFVAVGIGPGSYTGARIGVVFAKTFAFARGLPLVGVSALEAAALRLFPEGRSAVLMAAHSGHAYAALYECHGEAPPLVIREPSLVSRSAFLAEITEGDPIIEMPPETAWASDIGRVACRRAKTGLTSAEDTIEPLYLQAPSPERRPAP